MRNELICGLEYQDFLIQMEDFHGGRSPGMLIGAVLLDAALDRLGDTPNLGVVVETINCMPDAVQILTPCTVGNGMLHILDWSIFALTACDRSNLEGVRARLVATAVPGWPALNRWFNRLEPDKGPPPFADLAKEFLAGRNELVEAFDVRLSSSIFNKEKPETGLCPGCGESYPLPMGGRCISCQGKGYYQALDGE